MGPSWFIGWRRRLEGFEQWNSLCYYWFQWDGTGIQQLEHKVDQMFKFRFVRLVCGIQIGSGLGLQSPSYTNLLQTSSFLFRYVHIMPNATCHLSSGRRKIRQRRRSPR